jgi:hypothetical protein
MLKRIETKTEKEKRQKIRNLIIGIIIVALMILSTLGYVIVERNTTESNKIEYNGFEFTSTQNGWQTEAQGEQIVTAYLPEETLDVNSNVSGTLSLYNFQGKTIYITISDEQESYGSYDLINDLNNMAKRIQFACSPENENSSFCKDKNLPIKSCDDVDQDSGVIEIKTNSTTSYLFKDGCLTIQGEGSGLIKASDNFIFKLFDIIV